MFGKIVLMEILLSSFLFSMSATMVQNAPKEKLKCIKGLGIKRVQSIATYRQKNTINSLDKLLNINPTSSSKISKSHTLGLLSNTK